MSLDPSTVALVTIFTTLLTGILLLYSWLKDRSTISLGLWAMSLFIGSVAGGLLFARGKIPDFLSIDLANGLLSAGYGVMWSAARAFDQRRLMPWYAVAGAITWVGACQIEPFYASVTSRIALVCIINGSYSALTALELWFNRSERLASRFLVITLLSFHSLALFVRLPLSLWLAPAADIELIQWKWVKFSTLDSLFFVVTLSFTVAMMSKERIQARYQRAAQTDPLTGVLNRRALFARGERLLSERLAVGQPVAAFVFDLDNFKRINDRYGHLGGDLALKTFCMVASAELGCECSFGRLGGEEFGGLIPTSSINSALELAEKVRSAFEKSKIAFGPGTFSTTVSIGVALANQDHTTLIELFCAADKELFSAKALGRNRVEWSDPARGNPRTKLNLVQLY